MNRFAWDLRVEDPREIPGAFYADEGPRGPVVNPGSYVVSPDDPQRSAVCATGSVYPTRD